MATSLTEERALLELSPAERDRQDVTDEDVTEALLSVIRHGSAEQKRFTDCSFPSLALSYLTVEADENHPVVFENCTFEDGIAATHAHLKVPVHFDSCTVGGLAADDAWFESDVVFDGSTMTGPVSCFEARFDRDAGFDGVTFKSPVTFDETVFSDDTHFDGAEFAAEASFRASTFHGTSNELDDNASFEGAVFAADATFRQADFEHTDLSGARFQASARFEEAQFDDDVLLAGTRFDGRADFDEVSVHGDLTLEDAVFAADATFRGCELHGGARSLHEDASIAGVTFEGTVAFDEAHVRGFDATAATFAAAASFEAVTFTGDAVFDGCAFDGETRFDESQFAERAVFTDARFRGPTTFTGVAFRGETTTIEASAAFTDARFEADTDFSLSSFTTADFDGVRFGGRVDFSETVAEQSSRFRFEPTTNETYVDFTGAVLKDAAITQPDGGWVRYDFTTASLGAVSFRASTDTDRKRLLDYFRFCNTEFNEFDGYDFDFAAHTEYFDRNDWAIHTFDENDADVDYAVEMTPATVETTYLRAKTAASAAGQMKPAGEFRVKRQAFARRKYVDIATDATADLSTRLSNASRALENAFLGVTCGHGMRLVRIAAVFLLAPMLPALLYAFGGPAFETGAGQLSSLGALATASGRAVLYENIHFSYITFLTIGYGNIGPQGALARLLAGLEVYASVVLSGLVLYGLIKRSEI